MNTMLLAMLVSLAAVAIVAPSGVASHCNGTVIQVQAGPETLYIDDRSSLGVHWKDVWFYLEGNGVAGLQSGGDWTILEDSIFPSVLPDPCDHWPQDLMII